MMSNGDHDPQAVRARLEARRNEMRERIAVLTKRPERRTALGFGKRIGDGTTEAVSRLTYIGVGDSLERMLTRTEGALTKLDEGTYGICDSCGRSISAGPMKPLPDGVLCLPCARIAAILELTEVDVLIGGDDWALEGYAVGAVGWVSGVWNVAPAACVELQDHVLAGRLPQARELYRRLQPLARLDMTPHLVQYVKAAMDAVGLRGGPSRPPRRSLDAEQMSVLDAALRALGAPAPA